MKRVFPMPRSAEEVRRVRQFAETCAEIGEAVGDSNMCFLAIGDGECIFHTQRNTSTVLAEVVIQ